MPVDLISGVISNAAWDALKTAVQMVYRASSYEKMQKAIADLEQLQQQETQLREIIAPFIDSVKKDIESANIAGAANTKVVEQSLDTLKAQLANIMSKLAPNPEAWIKEGDPKCLIAMLLAGRWDPTNKADCEAVSRLADNLPFNDVENLCTALAGEPNNVVIRVESTWQWISSEDAWLALVRRITDSQLNNFINVAVEILSESDPRYEMEVKERIYAEVYGKVLKYSSALRKGIAESVVRLSIHNRDLKKVYGTSKGEDAARRIVNKVLRSEWKTWASLSDVLDILAEASPSIFLDKLEESIQLASCGVIELFKQENEWGVSPHTSVLWSLEKLGWGRDLMPRVAYLLAELSQKEPGGRLSNRPAASLSNLLHIRMPQTTADYSDRLMVLKTIKEKYPEASWKLLIGYIKSLGGGMFMPSSQPKYLQWDIPDRLNRVDSEEISNFLYEIFVLALSQADSIPLKYSELLDSIHLAPDDYENMVLEKVAQMVPFLQQNDPSNFVWHSLRNYLHYLYLADDPVSKHGKILELTSSLYAELEPQDIIERYAWLFENGWIDLPEPLKTGKEDEPHREELRCEALRNVLALSDDKLKILRKFTVRVNDKHLLGRSCANLDKSANMEEMIFKLQKEDGLFKDLFSGYCFETSRSHGFEWATSRIDELLRVGNLDSAVLIALNTTHSSNLWEFLDSKSAELKEKYWQEVYWLYGCSNYQELEIAVRNLLEVNRPQKAVQILPFYLNKFEVSSVLIFNVLVILKDVLERNDVKLLAGNSIDSYEIGEMFENLRPTDEINANMIMALEVYFLPLLEHSDKPLTHLFIYKYLNSNPEAFAELVSYIYRNENETEEERERQESLQSEENRQIRQNRAGAAYRLLHSWTGYPGESLAGDEQQNYIQEWVKKVLAIASDIGRKETAQSEVANVLARIPYAEDGIWPCMAARHLLESRAYSELKRYLVLAKCNLRGVTQRGMTEGGAQERVLADEFSKWSEELRIGFPQTASMLKMLAENYLREAEREDESAKAMQLR